MQAWWGQLDRVHKVGKSLGSNFTPYLLSENWEIKPIVTKTRCKVIPWVPQDHHFPLTSSECQGMLTLIGTFRESTLDCFACPIDPPREQVESTFSEKV